MLRLCANSVLFPHYFEVTDICALVEFYMKSIVYNNTSFSKSLEADVSNSDNNIKNMVFTKIRNAISLNFAGEIERIYGTNNCTLSHLF